MTKCLSRCSTLRLFGVLILEWLLAVQRLGKRKLYTVLYINRRLLSLFIPYILFTCYIVNKCHTAFREANVLLFSSSRFLCISISLHRSFTNTSWFLFANMLQAIHMLRICTRTCHPSAAPYSTDIQCIITIGYDACPIPSHFPLINALQTHWMLTAATIDTPLILSLWNVLEEVRTIC